MLNVTCDCFACSIACNMDLKFNGFDLSIVFSRIKCRLVCKSFCMRNESVNV